MTNIALNLSQHIKSFIERYDINSQEDYDYVKSLIIDSLNIDEIMDSWIAQKGYRLKVSAPVSFENPYNLSQSEIEVFKYIGELMDKLDENWRDEGYQLSISEVFETNGFNFIYHHGTEIDYEFSIRISNNDPTVLYITPIEA